MDEVIELHHDEGSEALTIDELQALPDGVIADRITTWAGRIAAGEARLLAYLGEFDAREAWGGPGLLDCAHWMSWRIGMGLGPAYERVRVARALRELPAIAAAFEGGQLSWTQVRAVTRTATPDAEQTYLHLARHASGAQIERLTRGVRRARKLAEPETSPGSIGVSARCDVRYDEDGTMVISARLPAEQGAVVLAALEQARADLDEQRRTQRASDEAAASGDVTSSPAPVARGCGQHSSAEECAAAPTESRDGRAANGTGGVAASDSACGQHSSAEEPAAGRADGLLRLCEDYLDHRSAERPDTARRARSRLTVRLDPLSGWARLPDGELLPPSAAMAACDLGRSHLHRWSNARLRRCHRRATDRFRRDCARCLPPSDGSRRDDLPQLGKAASGTIFASWNFCTLPVAVFGRSSAARNTTRSGTLNLASRCPQYATSSSASGEAPAAATTKATPTSPQ
jgi:hypothetical protein